jgi:hypothetical protein
MSEKRQVMPVVWHKVYLTPQRFKATHNMVNLIVSCYCCVTVADASEPGEGEHKVMKFVRHLRAQPGYDANTRHVVYGQDADLLLLTLLCHEPYFRVMREDMQGGEVGACAVSNVRRHERCHFGLGKTCCAPCDQILTIGCLQVLDVYCYQWFVSGVRAGRRPAAADAAVPRALLQGDEGRHAGGRGGCL